MPLSTKLPWELAQTKWPAELNPVLALPVLKGHQIDDLSLTAAVPLVINHRLSRFPQGWFLVDNTANAVIWRSQPFNRFTLTLTSTADTTISIWVY